jgi:aspartate/tyrosine/aromatic aminotransferase
MKKLVGKWFEREKNDIRQKIEERRHQIIRKLKKHQKLARDMK